MPGGGMARLFVALDPPPWVCERLAAWARGAAVGLDLRGRSGSRGPLRLLEPRSLHLTLCFLGSRPVGEIEAIGSALGACEADVGPLSVGAPLWLPPRRPRTLAVQISDQAGALGELHAAVTLAITGACGWEPERRRFRAHITVARMREGAVPGRSAGAVPSLAPTPQLRFAPESLALYRSWLDREGASYEQLAAYALPAEP